MFLIMVRFLLKSICIVSVYSSYVYGHELDIQREPFYHFESNSKLYDKTGVFFCVTPKERKTPEVDEIINEYNSKIYSEYYNTEMAKYAGNIGFYSGAVICPVITAGVLCYCGITNRLKVLGVLGVSSASCAYLGNEAGKRIVGGTHYAADYIKNLVVDSVKNSFQSAKEQFFGKSERYAPWYQGYSNKDYIRVTETSFNHPDYDESKYYPLTCSVATATIKSEKIHDNLYLRGEYYRATIIRDPNSDKDEIKVDSTGDPKDSICTLVATADVKYFDDISSYSKYYFYEFLKKRDMPYDEFNRGSCSASYDFVKYAINGDTRVIDASDINKGIGTKVRTNWNNKGSLDFIVKGKSSGNSHDNEDTKAYFDTINDDIKKFSLTSQRGDKKALPGKGDQP